MLKRIDNSILFLYNYSGDNMKKRKILKILLKIIIFILIVVGIIFLVKFIDTKQIIEEEITDISIICMDTGHETKLKKEEIIDFSPYLVDIYKIKDSNFNKWDLVPKIKIVINKKNTLKITDYDDAYYYGYYNENTVKIPKDVYKLSSKYCEEVQDGQK